MHIKPLQNTYVGWGLIVLWNVFMSNLDCLAEVMHLDFPELLLQEES